MAQRTQVLLLDDLDGGNADETVTFGLDGVVYEIDLSTKHAEELRNKLERYTGKARRGDRVPTRSGSAPRPARSRSSSARNAAIRAWAKLKGLDVSDRGRISADIVEQWEGEGSPGL